MFIRLTRELSKQTINRHIIVWCCVLVNFIFFTSITGNIISKIIWVLTLMLNYAFSYYVLLLVIWPNIFDKKKISFIFLLLILPVFFILIYYIQVVILIPSLGGKLAVAGLPLNLLIKKFLINFSYVFFSSLGSYYNWRGVKQIEDAAKMDKNILERELIFLKNQFHSHLTFNFLNFCYNKIRHFSPETSVTVGEFSDMLRYSLKGKADELVSLEKEINYIKNFISFQKCLTSELYVTFKYEGDISNVYILPRILVVFIENSLKHGVLYDPKNPVIIFISSIQNKIHFNIQNKKTIKKKLSNQV